MKWLKPENFDGAKFAARYSLRVKLPADFWADEKFIYLRDGIVLPDDPPIFEPPDPPKPGLADRLDAVKNLPDLIKLLKEELP